MKSIVAIFTAAAIATTAIAATGTAQAAPLTAPSVVQMQDSAPAVETVGYRHRRRVAAGTAAGIAIGLSAIAIGSALATPRPRRCYIERVEVWSPRRQAFIIRDREVCR